MPRKVKTLPPEIPQAVVTPIIEAVDPAPKEEVTPVIVDAPVAPQSTEVNGVRITNLPSGTIRYDY